MVPYFEFYFLADQLQWVAKWLAGCNIAEMGEVGALHHKGALSALMLGVRLIATHYPVLLAVALRCWRAVFKKTQWSPLYMLALPLVGLPTAGGEFHMD